MPLVKPLPTDRDPKMAPAAPCLEAPQGGTAGKPGARC